MGYTVALYMYWLFLSPALVYSQYQDIIADRPTTTPATPAETMLSIFVAEYTGSVGNNVEVQHPVETVFGEPFHDEREFVQWEG